jgi:hypothetical protein
MLPLVPSGQRRAPQSQQRLAGLLTLPRSITCHSANRASFQTQSVETDCAANSSATECAADNAGRPAYQGLLPHFSPRPNFVILRRIASEVPESRTMDDLADLEFPGLVLEAARGQREPLIAYLRSQRPLRQQDREYLADLIAGKLNRKRGRPKGGPNARNLRNLAVLVEIAKRELRKRGWRKGIHDQAINWAMEWHASRGHPPAGREQLENYLRRSRKPRKK